MPARAKQDGKAETFPLRIESLAAEGLGVGHAQGRAVFIPQVVPGELVLARPLPSGGRRQLAQAVQILEASAWRREPPCPVFGECGGCSLQHIEDSRQLALKSVILLDALRSIAGMEPPPLQLFESAQPFGYRNRGQYPVARRQDRIVSGFFARGTHRVVPVESCPLHHPRVDEAVRQVRAWANRKKISVYDEARHLGWLRHITARVSSDGEKTLVTLVAREQQRMPLGDLLRRLRLHIPGLAGLACNIQPARSNVVFGRRTVPWWGEELLPENFLGLRLRLSPTSFFQVNFAVAEKLFSRAVEFAAEAGGPLLDVFCGIGLGALLAARRGLEAAGIELQGPAVQSAHQAAAANRLEAKFYQGRAEQVLPRLIAGGFRPRALLLDPPRAGCQPAVLQALAESQARRVAYISCHPGTLARDLRQLLAAGFRLRGLEAFDMFPQTAHLETLALLER